MYGSNVTLELSLEELLADGVIIETPDEQYKKEKQIKKTENEVFRCESNCYELLDFIYNVGPVSSKDYTSAKSLVELDFVDCICDYIHALGNLAIAKI